ncbi:hypothetical protein FB446DRAFT_666033, partial [Lentinula raphanica]
MSSTLAPESGTPDSKSPKQESELLELMREFLHECRKKNKETKMPGSETEKDGDDSDQSKKPSGTQKQRVQPNPFAVNYNYRLKYPEDELYHEHDPEARIWWVYLDEAAAFDKDMIDELGDSLDVLLIFAGLFSAVITTFVAQTSQALSVDNESLSTSYLKEISTILRAGGNVSTILQIPTTDTTFSPATGDIWVNGLWFTSLTLALSVALIAVLAKQWLRQYMSIVTGTARERAFIRQFRFDGLKTWKVQEIIGILPVLLHLSLIIFLIGLIVFLVPLDVSLACMTGAITVIIIMLYLAANLLPLCVV